MSNRLARVRALIARAAHPETPLEEARTSAHVACKLIAEDKLELSAPASSAPPPGQVRGGHQPGASNPFAGASDPFRDIDDIFRRWGVNVSSPAGSGAGSRGYKAPKNYYSRVSNGSDVCSKCHDRIARNNFCWDVDGGTRCSRCVFL